MHTLFVPAAAIKPQPGKALPESQRPCRLTMALSASITSASRSDAEVGRL
jgi:hypothetical protein